MISSKKIVKVCYEQVGGKWGSLLLEQFVGNGWLAKENNGDKNYYITSAGEIEFEKLGVDLEKVTLGK